MQVHISLTHNHFTLPNDCFYIAPFSVRKTQLYVCTNHCNCKACPQYRAWVVGTPIHARPTFKYMAEI